MTQLTPDAGAPPAKAAPASDRLGIFSWCLFDWANSAFNTVIGTFVFSVYFARGIYGDETAGAAVWAYAIGLSGLAVAVLAPIFGAIADHSGRRKPWIAVFIALTVVPTALLWDAQPDREFVVYTLALVVVASIAFELAGVFYNAMLPDIAPRRYLGRVSGWAWGLGYAGGLACLVLALVVLIRPETPWFGLSKDGAEHVRATGPLVAIWFTIFALPLFLFTKDAPSTGAPGGQAVRRGMATLVQTLKQATKYPQIVRFLVASALYRDGLVTLFAIGGLYAADTFGMSQDEIIQFAIGLNVTAGLGAAGFAWLDDGVGSKRTILVALAGLIVCGLAVLLVFDPTHFVVLALFLGIFVGPAQAASRSLMARLSPPELETEMFGLYAMTGKSIAFLGPILFAGVTLAFDSQRAGMATIILFWLVGGALLLTVQEPKRFKDPA